MTRVVRSASELAALAALFERGGALLVEELEAEIGFSQAARILNVSYAAFEDLIEQGVLDVHVRKNRFIGRGIPVEYRVLQLGQVLDYLDARDAQRRLLLDEIAKMSAQEEMDS